MAREVLHIKKYPNRRYYNATKSCHITLQEIYDIVATGRDVVVTDSRTGDDITSLVLLQVLLERDPPKLDVFPASVLHAMIRSNQNVLRTIMERYFGPFLRMVATSQRQFDNYLRDAMQGRLVTPFEWATQLLNSMAVNGRHADGTADTEPEPEMSNEPQPAEEEGERSSHDEAIAELRDQLSELTQRIETIMKDSGKARDA